MTNEEYLEKKIKDTIEDEYQKYLKSLKIPSKEEWLKMEHKEAIKHKFNVGDIIVKKQSECYYIVTDICDDGTYELKGKNDSLTWYEKFERIDKKYDY